MNFWFATFWRVKDFGNKSKGELGIFDLYNGVRRFTLEILGNEHACRMALNGRISLFEKAYFFVRRVFNTRHPRDLYCIVANETTMYKLSYFARFHGLQCKLF